MASPPRFFLSGPPASAGGPVRLAEGEAEHARRVLRLAPGDAAVGLDGRGRTWPLRVKAAGRRALELELAGPPEVEPEPGAPGAPLPWIEVAVAFPRRPRAEAMVRRLTQLGAAAIAPLRARQAGPQAAPDAAAERWERILRDACKQSRRAWLPELDAPRTPLELALARTTGALALLDPAGAMALDVWARSLRAGPEGLGTRERPITLAVGPEGGFGPEERDALRTRGATPTRVAPHVLRIETAAEAALAVVVGALMR